MPRATRSDYEPTHQRELHLIVVSRDTSSFQHPDPERGVDGTWSTEIDLRETYAYPVFVDFRIDGQLRTLATDGFAPGDFRPKRLLGGSFRDVEWVVANRTSTDEADASGCFSDAYWGFEPRSGLIPSSYSPRLTSTGSSSDRSSTSKKPLGSKSPHLATIEFGKI